MDYETAVVVCRSMRKQYGPDYVVVRMNGGTFSVQPLDLARTLVRDRKAEVILDTV